MRHAAFLLFLLTPLVGHPLVGRNPVAPPALLSDDLDRVIQNRFGNLTDDDIHQGRLGMSRILRPPSKKQFLPQGDVEIASLAGIRKRGWSASFYVLGDHGRLYGPIGTDPKAVPGRLDRAEVSKLGKQAMNARAALQELRGSVRLEARPIPVSGPSCASCHDPSLKLGDPLGAVVYAFTRDDAP